jgi:hypothetical protein
MALSSGLHGAGKEKKTRRERGRGTRREHEMAVNRWFVALAVLLVNVIAAGKGTFSPVPYAAAQDIKDVIAAQIRTQGFTCDHPQRAVRDAKKSGPDHDVWILKCENATYRYSRYPDMAAKVEVVR